jgi:hypothetical protein
MACCCPICYENYSTTLNIPKVLTGCGHTFCLMCITRITVTFKVKCPTCRKFSDFRKLVTNYDTLDSTSTRALLNNSTNNTRSSANGNRAAQRVNAQTSPIRTSNVIPRPAIPKNPTTRVAITNATATSSTSTSSTVISTVALCTFCSMPHPLKKTIRQTGPNYICRGCQLDLGPV